jgi:tripartite-type tricarboxylate transporter receptor subunit TctC
MKLLKNLIISLMLVSGTVLAQSKQSITLVVGFPPGSGNDVVARQVAKDIEVNGGPIIVVENKIGAGGNIAVQEVVNSKTPKLFLHSNSLYISSIVTKTMNLNLETQLLPVAFIGNVPTVLVTGSNSNIRHIENVQKAKSGELTYGSGGIGSLTHANMAYLSYLLNTPMIHIPYLGSVRGLLDLSADRIDLYFDFYNTSKILIADGRIRPLAITGSKRLKELPDVPTFKEKGIDWPLEAFYMLYASPNMDPAVINHIKTVLLQSFKSDPAPYEKQSIQLDLKKLAESEQFHKDTIKIYQSLDFPKGLIDEKSR